MDRAGRSVDPVDAEAIARAAAKILAAWQDCIGRQVLRPKKLESKEGAKLRPGKSRVPSG